jgi:uncharacterized protein (UPF0335 family)
MAPINFLQGHLLGKCCLKIKILTSTLFRQSQVCRAKYQALEEANRLLHIQVDGMGRSLEQVGAENSELKLQVARLIAAEEQKSNERAEEEAIINSAIKSAKAAKGIAESNYKSAVEKIKELSLEKQKMEADIHRLRMERNEWRDKSHEQASAIKATLEKEKATSGAAPIASIGDVVTPALGVKMRSHAQQTSSYSKDVDKAMDSAFPAPVRAQISLLRLAYEDVVGPFNYKTCMLRHLAILLAEELEVSAYIFVEMSSKKCRGMSELHSLLISSYTGGDLSELTNVDPQLRTHLICTSLAPPIPRAYQNSIQLWICPNFAPSLQPLSRATLESACSSRHRRMLLLACWMLRLSRRR